MKTNPFGNALNHKEVNTLELGQKDLATKFQTTSNGKTFDEAKPIIHVCQK